MTVTDLPQCLFFARVKDPNLLELVEFYREDIETLRSLGYRVLTVTSNRRVPRLRRPDVAYVWWHHSSFPAILWLRLRGVPVIVTGAWHAEEKSRTVRDATRTLLSRTAARLATVNVAISQVELRGLSFLPRSRALAIPLSVDTEYFVPLERRVAGADAITVGQLNLKSIERKGIDLAIRSVPLIVEEIPDYHLHVVGLASADGEALVRSLVDEGCSTHVTIHGGVSRDRKRQLLQSSDVYLQLSTIEGFGLSALEALSCGVPVVHSGRGSLPEVVGAAGLVAHERTTESVAAAVVGYLERTRADGALNLDARAQAESFSRTARTARLGAVLETVRGTRWRRPSAPG